MTTPPNPPPYSPQPGGHPPQQPGWGPPPQGFPAQPGHPGPGYPAPPGYGAQPPGYQGPPPNQGYPPPGGFPPPQDFPPPPKKKTSTGAKALIGVVVLGIAAIVVIGMIAGAGSPGRANAGDCIKVNSASVGKADVDTVDCSSPEAAFKVAVNLDSSTSACPSGDYFEYSDRGGRRSNGFKLCLVFNAKQGDCFKQEGTIVAGKTTKVTCDSSATHKVTKVVNTSDENACASGEAVVVYSQPATTLCLVKTE
ncbi:LppU/SCO3897 family protein [Actinosynnema sp. CS-041913]|uniref:LppU/SCO3897 family protein n=1 Tax=Actinosynnema sp. CS-041913 TaxID=3239917 RepID=UPI003D93DA59